MFLPVLLLLVLLPRIRGPAEQQLPWIRLGRSQVPQLAIRHFSRVFGLPRPTGLLGRPTEPPSLSVQGRVQRAAPLDRLAQERAVVLLRDDAATCRRLTT